MKGVLRLGTRECRLTKKGAQSGGKNRAGREKVYGIRPKEGSVGRERKKRMVTVKKSWTAPMGMDNAWVRRHKPKLSKTKVPKPGRPLKRR